MSSAALPLSFCRCNNVGRYLSFCWLTFACTECPRRITVQAERAESEDFRRATSFLSRCPSLPPGLKERENRRVSRSSFPHSGGNPMRMQKKKERERTCCMCVPKEVETSRSDLEVRYMLLRRRRSPFCCTYTRNRTSITNIS